ncbi:MAG: hypothetical protein A2474_05495 [Elusimicrobia bacterium RIFOXYC2_FULL_34_12]|nr:MAG: hypothetical protein A2474_05495 [Elusimicrobia bacterium RIFOXYC2_FULL_34_12]OGS39322.1 MAG: hypothetical protein A2551_07530 [Elusimicrobia bacterium RIFOXYD2_FULL_34_30]HAM39570.1 Stp1/IreP family PP2C-type Ser/Thr phosphatase [Elusimicrobiota bacterium]
MKEIITAYGKTDQGLIRKNNEDNFSVSEDINLFLVADGMGGHASGQVASKMAVDIVKEQMEHGFKNNKIEDYFASMGPTKSKYANYLVNCLKIANNAIFEASQNYPQNSGMGTTIVASLIIDGKLIIAHVGDSRLYLIRDNDINPLTTDHSVVMEQVRRGLITLEQASKSDIQNILTRALGIEKTVNADVSEMPLNNDDYILLCSDGLLRMVPDEQILKTINEFKEPNLICEKLVSMANDAGGRDNITIIVVNIKKGVPVMKDKIKNFFRSIVR